MADKIYEYKDKETNNKTVYYKLSDLEKIINK